MAKYILKDALVAEIEKLRKYFWESFQKGNSTEDQYCLRDGVIRDIFSLLDTLEVIEIKEDNVWHDARKVLPEDSTNQIICIKEDGLAIITIGKIVNNTTKWAYLNDLKE